MIMLRNLFYFNYHTLSHSVNHSQKFKKFSPIVNLLVKNKRNLVSLESHAKQNTESDENNLKGKEEKKNFNHYDPDTFGTLSKKPFRIINEPEGDEDDQIEEEYIKRPPRRVYSSKKYADLIKNYFQKGEIEEAIDVLQKKMLQDDRVVPNNYIYNLLISELSRLGHTKQCFSLYNQMKKRALKPTGATYTALFNSCATCPDMNFGLERATHLKELITEKNIKLNRDNYNSMIKAFGRCGDIQIAFSIIDEMKEEKIFPDDRTLNCLLQASISDTEGGFIKVLWLWRKLISSNKIKPNIFTFNLLIRTIQYCGIGNIEKAQETINSIFDEVSPKNLLVESNSNSDSKEITQNINISPNLLSPLPYFGNNLSLNEVQKPHERLILIGGLNSILEEMKRYDINPNIKTFTQILEIIPNTTSFEKFLLKKMESFPLTYDVNFYNMLIKKRSFRFDYEGGRNVLNMINEKRLLPDIITFGVLALCCDTIEKTEELISLMDHYGFRINQEILGAILKCATLSYDILYVMDIFHLYKRFSIQPNETVIKMLDSFEEKLIYILRKGYLNTKGESQKVDAKLKYNIKNFFIEYKKFKNGQMKLTKKPNSLKTNIHMSKK